MNRSGSFVPTRSAEPSAGTGSSVFFEPGGLAGYTVASAASTGAVANGLGLGAPLGELAAAQAEQASGIASVVAAGVLATYQTAITAEKVNQAWKHGKDQRALHSLEGELHPQALEATRQTVERQKQYHMAGAAFHTSQAVLQAVTLTGAALSLTVAGAPVGGPMFLAGVGGTVGTAPIGVAINHKQHRFSGAGAGPEALARARQRDTAQSIEDRGLLPTIHAVGQEIMSNQRTLVEAKLMSLIEFAVSKEKVSDRATARRVERARIDTIEELVRTGRKGPLTGTTLLKSEITAMQHRFRELVNQSFFAGHREAVLGRVVDAMRADETADMLSESTTVRTRVLKKTLQKLQRSEDEAIVAVVRRAPGQHSRPVDENQLNSLAESNEAARAALTQSKAAEYPQAAKRHAAFGRGELTQAMVDLSKTKAIIDGRALARREQIASDVETTYL